jgi:hypothetical protein
VIAVDNELAFRSAWQFEAIHKWVSRVHASVARIAFTSVVVAVAAVILFAIRRAHIHPRHLDIADVIVAI